MAPLNQHKLATAEPELQNRLRQRRQAARMSQQQLADNVGITRQAVAAVETNQYSPSTSVSLRLSRALQCRVEDLFSFKSSDQTIEGELLGGASPGRGARVQVMQVGKRVLIRPLDGHGELASLSASADGLITESPCVRNRVKVKLLNDRENIQRKLVVGGCDPALYVAGEYFRKYQRENLVSCLMGSSLALAALKRGEIHVAGIHLAEEKSGEWKLPDLRRALGNLKFMVVTFAYWEEGLIVPPANPKELRGIADLARPKIKFVNRESGSGARRLLDKHLKALDPPATAIEGYGEEVYSHFDIAARVKAGLADAGIGVRSAAAIYGLGFVPLQRERYDLVIPKASYAKLSGLQLLLDTMASSRFHDELESLGGYDMRESGKVVDI